MGSLKVSDVRNYLAVELCMLFNNFLITVNFASTLEYRLHTHTFPPIHTYHIHVLLCRLTTLVRIAQFDDQFFSAMITWLLPCTPSWGPSLASVQADRILLNVSWVPENDIISPERRLKNVILYIYGSSSSGCECEAPPQKRSLRIRN